MLSSGELASTRANASAPVLVRDAAQAGADRSLGNETFRLLGIVDAPGALKGQKVLVTGLLIRNPDGSRLNVQTLKAMAQACAN